MKTWEKKETKQNELKCKRCEISNRCKKINGSFVCLKNNYFIYIPIKPLKRRRF